MKFLTVYAIKVCFGGKWEDASTNVYPHWKTEVVISLDCIESISQEAGHGEDTVMICTKSGGAVVARGSIESIIQGIEEAEA